MIWQVIGASVQGSGHLRVNLPCQDAFKFQVLDDCVIAAVADGLGSAAKAEKGAMIAVESVLQVLDTVLAEKPTFDLSEWKQIIITSFEKARQDIEFQAKSEGIPLREFGTTLIVVVVTPDCLSVGHLGDGTVVALLENGDLMTISPPQRGEYANEVIPLTGLNALEFVRYTSQPNKTRCVAMMTDGLQGLSINLATQAPYAPFFEPFFEAIVQEIDTEAVSKQLAEFLASERICERTDDDKTLVIMGKVSE